MIILNGKRHYAAEIRAMKQLPFHGWDSCHDSKIQQYFVCWNRETGLTSIEATSCNDIWGEDYTEYFNSPAEFRQWVDDQTVREFERLLGDVDEDNADAMEFIDAAYRT